MIRLAVLGTLSAHSEGFCRHAASSDRLSIAGIFGEDPQRNAYLCETYGVEEKSPQELLECCDAAAIMFRSGDKHLPYAEAFIKKGLPVFIDKPFTRTAEDAVRLLELCRQYGSPFCGGSCVKLSEEILELKKKVQAEKRILSGYLTFPIHFESPYGGMHFYSHHLIETMLQVFGLGVRSITAVRTGDLLTAVAAYDDFQVTLNYGVRDGQYAAGYFGENGWEMTKFNWNLAPEAQFDELVTFAETKQSVYPAEFFLEAVKISCAMEQSMAEQKTVFI